MLDNCCFSISLLFFPTCSLSITSFLSLSFSLTFLIFHSRSPSPLPSLSLSSSPSFSLTEPPLPAAPDNIRQTFSVVLCTLALHYFNSALEQLGLDINTQNNWYLLGWALEKCGGSCQPCVAFRIFVRAFSFFENRIRWARWWLELMGPFQLRSLRSTDSTACADFIEIVVTHREIMFVY